MKMKIDDLCGKVTEYAATKLLPSARGWGARAVIGGALPVIPNYIRMIAKTTMSVDETGMVDVERLKTMVVSGFKAAGHLDVFNGVVGFDVSDVENLFAFIEGRGAQS